MSKATTAAPGTAVVPASTGAALPAVPQELAEQFAANAGAGMEQMTTADKAIPFIGLVQSLSPQRKKDNPKYIEGAEEGDIFNTVTRELFKGSDGALVIPVDFAKVYNKWVPRSEGGGFLGSFADADCKHPITGMARNAEYDGPEQVVPTANHFVLIQAHDGSWQQALLSMKSTQLTVSRRWASQMSMVFVPGPDGKRVPAPTFAKVYRLRSAPAKNDKGEFYNYTIEDAGWVDQEAFALAMQFRQSLLAGRVTVDYTKAADADASGSLAEDGGKDDLPF